MPRKNYLRTTKGMSERVNGLKYNTNATRSNNHCTGSDGHCNSQCATPNGNSECKHKVDKYKYANKGQHLTSSSPLRRMSSEAPQGNMPKSGTIQRTKWTDPLRKWQYTPLGQRLKKFDNYGRNPGVVFTFMSYNVLSQVLLDRHPHLYKEHSKSHLSWSHRWKCLQSELEHYNADIVCLQEVQESHLDEYKVFFKKHGYSYIYKKRTSAEYPDGCAVIYKTKKFKMLEHETVEYNQSSNSSLVNRNNVAIIVRFAPVDNLNHSFVVATTHLLYNPRREDVRLAQMQLLLAELDRIAFVQSLKAYRPVLLCGDFNSTPFLGVRELLLNKGVSYQKFMDPRKSWIPFEIGITNNCKHLLLEFNRLNNPDAKLSRSEETNLINLKHTDRSDVAKNSNYELDIFETGNLTHVFDFVSIYGVDGVTTNQDEWINVDYMFYSKSDVDSLGAIKFLRKCELPTKEILAEFGVAGIPNEYLGSDHFSLTAEFKFEY